jgi:hypothetical protein
MFRKLFLLLLVFSPFCLHAQSADSGCDHIFVVAQHLPSLKISNDDYGDSLKAILQTKDFPLKNYDITYSFVVTDKSAIDNIKAILGKVPKEKILQEAILQEAILQEAHLWNPATQNGYVVCASVQLHLQISKNKISVEVL